MSAPKHTPGPWSYRKCPCGMAGCDQYKINTQGSVGFSEEDARLIAASPELLEALQGMLVEKPIDEILAYAKAAKEKARAVIAKATGEAA